MGATATAPRLTVVPDVPPSAPPSPVGDPWHSRPSTKMAAAIVAAVALVAAVTLVATRGGPVTDHGTAREIQRSVQIGDGERFVPVGERPSVRAGDVVRTDATGIGEIDYEDGSKTRLDSNTIFRIEALTNGPARVMEATLDVGRTWNSIEKLTSSSDRFEVKTPTATATVQGTIFVAECLPECTFIGIEGETRISNDLGQVRPLGAGDCTTQGREDELGPCRYTADELANMPFLQDAAAAEGIELPWGAQGGGRTLLEDGTSTPAPIVVPSDDGSAGGGEAPPADREGDGDPQGSDAPDNASPDEDPGPAPVNDGGTPPIDDGTPPVDDGTPPVDDGDGGGPSLGPIDTSTLPLAEQLEPVVSVIVDALASLGVG